MDDENTGTNDGAPDSNTDTTDHGHPEEGAAGEIIAETDTSITGTAATIVDKTLEQIKAEADALAGKVEDAVEGTIAKVRHAGHDVLDEMEQHLSQFDAYTVAVYHGFLNRLRNLL